MSVILNEFSRRERERQKALWDGFRSPPQPKTPSKIWHPDRSPFETTADWWNKGGEK